MKRVLMFAAALGLAVSLSAKSKQAARTYDFHGTVTEMGTQLISAGWFTVAVREYTIKSTDRSYLVVYPHRAGGKTPLTLGQKVDFRIDGRRMFIPGADGKEMRFALTKESLEPAPAGNEPSAAR